MIITSILNSYIFYVFGAKIWKNTVGCVVFRHRAQCTGIMVNCTAYIRNRRIYEKWNRVWKVWKYSQKVFTSMHSNMLWSIGIWLNEWGIMGTFWWITRNILHDNKIFVQNTQVTFTNMEKRLGKIYFRRPPVLWCFVCPLQVEHIDVLNQKQVVLF